MKQLYLEYTCIYVRNYNIMLRLKDNGEWNENDGILSRMRNMVNAEIYDKMEQICEDSEHKCNARQLVAWSTHFKDEPFMVKGREARQKLDTDVFEA